MKKYWSVSALVLLALNISFCFAKNKAPYIMYMVGMNVVGISFFGTFGYAMMFYFRNKFADRKRELPLVVDMLIQVVFAVSMALSVQYMRDLPYVLRNETVKNLEVGKVAINYKGEGFVQIKRHRFKVDLDQWGEGRTAIVVYDALPHTDIVMGYVIE